jgi:hypothetical protein
MPSNTNHTHLYNKLNINKLELSTWEAILGKELSQTDQSWICNTKELIEKYSVIAKKQAEAE